MAEAASSPKSCPGKLSTYSTDAARTRRVWNSSLGLIVRPFCKSFGKASKVANFLSFEGRYDIQNESKSCSEPSLEKEVNNQAGGGEVNIGFKMR